MKLKFIIPFLFFSASLSSQSDSLLIKPGSIAPSFILNLKENSIRSFTMPYMRKIVLLHFWSTNIKKSRTVNRYLNRIGERYVSAQYRNAEGFEIISVAVQTDRNAWKEAILKDTLTNFTHVIALRGYVDEVCRKYGVTSLPADILIDEYGIVMAVNPKMADIESLLDERKNIQPIRKDIIGTLAQSSNKEDVSKFIRLYLFNFYGDSLAKTITTAKGEFIFSEMKLNQDFILKVDNKIDITTSDPIALYAPTGEFIMDGRTLDNGFSFYISARNTNKLTEVDSLNPTTNSLGQIDVIKSLTFYPNGMGLITKDEKELNSIISLLMKDTTTKLDFVTHTDARMDAAYALELTTNQANSIKSYFLKKGIAAGRIKAIAKGNLELRKICGGAIDCREEDHKLNRRVEFLIYKN